VLRSKRGAETDGDSTAGEGHRFFEEGKMVARLFVDEVGAFDDERRGAAGTSISKLGAGAKT
jgi:hypothetical protein